MSEEQILDTDVFKAVIARGSSLVMMDVIQYQGLFWLVPGWLDSPDGEWSKPRRIICLSILQHQDVRDNPNRLSDFAVNVPIPNDVLAGKIEGQAAIQYRVVELPPFRIRKPKIH